jgi:GNAT superfamily N-acetyltransferase
MFQYKLSPVTVWYLEMLNPPSFKISAREEIEFSLLKKPITCADYRKLYFGVGEKWQWLDRMVMPDEDLLEKINDADTEIFILSVGGITAGYVELVSKTENSEIQYFGLFPGFVGKGYGKYFLQWSILKAWAYPNTKKVSLNTCALDHPDALSIYKSCGFTEIKNQQEERKILI